MFIYDEVIHFDVEAILTALSSRVTFNKSSSSLHNMTNGLGCSETKNSIFFRTYKSWLFY